MVNPIQFIAVTLNFDFDVGISQISYINGKHFFGKRNSKLKSGRNLYLKLYKMW